MISPLQRRLLLAAALATTVVSAALMPGEEAAPPPKRAAAKAPSPPAAAQPPQRVAAREIAVPEVSNYQRSIAEGISVIDLFKAVAPPGPPAAPVKPVAPKPPFSYAGLISESGRPKAVLAQGDRLHIVAKGEQFGGSYRLEEVGPDMAVITYLPLDERQNLPMGTVQ